MKDSNLDTLFNEEQVQQEEVQTEVPAQEHPEGLIVRQPVTLVTTGGVNTPPPQWMDGMPEHCEVIGDKPLWVICDKQAGTFLPVLDQSVPSSALFDNQPELVARIAQMIHDAGYNAGEVYPSFQLDVDSQWSDLELAMRNVDTVAGIDSSARVALNVAGVTDEGATLFTAVSVGQNTQSFLERKSGMSVGMTVMPSLVASPEGVDVELVVKVDPTLKNMGHYILGLAALAHVDLTTVVTNRVNNYPNLSKVEKALGIPKGETILSTLSGRVSIALVVERTSTNSMLMQLLVNSANWTQYSSPVLNQTVDCSGLVYNAFPMPEGSLGGVNLNPLTTATAGTLDLLLQNESITLYNPSNSYSTKEALWNNIPGVMMSGKWNIIINVSPDVINELGSTLNMFSTNSGGYADVHHRTMFSTFGVQGDESTPVFGQYNISSPVIATEF